MDKFKTFGKLCFFILATVGVILTSVFAYYKITDNTYTTVTYNINDQTPIDLMEKADDLTQEEIDEYENRVLFNVNYYSNDNENGIELQEMRLDYFTDLSLSISSCRSTGMQFIGNFKAKEKEQSSYAEAQDYVPSDFYYYDSTNGVSFSGGNLATVLNRNTLFTIKIDNKPYQIQLTGGYEYSTFERQWYTLWIWNKETVHHVYYSYAKVFEDVINAVRTNSNGYGDYYITIDLTRYFSVYEYDSTTGKFDKSETADVVKNYCVLKFHYDENGARNSTQSMFNTIACNSSYDVEDTTVNTEYWQERIVYNLTNKDFDLRYSEVYDGYFVSLPIEMKTLFNKMSRTKVNITINMAYDNKNIVGIDYNGFENFEIDTLTINGTNATFYILEKGLYNTKLQTLQYSSGLTIDYGTNATNNIYTVVVV